MKRFYETTFIVDSQLEDQLTKESIERVKGFIANNGGEVVTVESLGTRKLAYPIRKRQHGHYAFIQFWAESSLVVSLDRQLRLDESILRHLTVVSEQRPGGKDKEHINNNVSEEQ